MKFPSLSSTLRLLKPSTKDKVKPKSNKHHHNEMTLYDKIEEIIAIADVDFNSLEIELKFYNLIEIHQQITVVTLIEHNTVEVLRKILLSNFDINFLIRGQTPLHFAIKNQNVNLVKLLIKFNADLELKDNYKETALNCAVRTGNMDIVKYFLEQGANVNTQASDSTTPLDYAVHNGDIDSVNILEKYGASLGNSYLVRSL